MTSGINSMRTDAPWKPAGPGVSLRALCMGCNQAMAQAGGKGAPGPRWRCSVCVAAKAVRVAT